MNYDCVKSVFKKLFESFFYKKLTFRDLAPVYDDGQMTVGRLAHLLVGILQKEFDYRHNAFFLNIQAQIGPFFHPGTEVEQVVHDMITDIYGGKIERMGREKEQN